MKYLRTMTLKSQMMFGQYHDMKVGDVLKLIKGKAYLIWAYFNLSMINFNEEIIIFLGLNIWRIEKPGTNLELYSKFVDKYYNNNPRCNGLIEHIKDKKYKKDQRQKRIIARNKEKIYFSKGIMQSRNQGHF